MRRRRECRHRQIRSCDAGGHRSNHLEVCQGGSCRDARCVCDACGLRHPDETYVDSGQELTELAANHWARANQTACERLRAEQPFELFTCKGDTVKVQRLSNGST